MHAGDLDQQVQFRRFALVDDGFRKTKVWQDWGLPVWAKKTDVRDGEKFSGGAVSAYLTSRFIVKSLPFTRGITTKDAIFFGGVSHDILGIKEVGRLDIIEITAGAEVSDGRD